MKCPNCERKTDVLQTFAHDDHVIRVRGHRDQSMCWIRTETIERFQGATQDLESAKEKIHELAHLIAQLKDFDFEMKRLLGLKTLYHIIHHDSVPTTDRD